MTLSDAYRAWAPDDSVWSAWAKPVLFAHLPEFLEPQPYTPGEDVSWAPPPTASTAIILDVEGERAVRIGLALARKSFRPVPLFNTTEGPMPLVNVRGILVMLAQGAGYLKTITIPPEAPPVFILDSHRLIGQSIASPGFFDNRWMVLPQDLPSGAFMRSHGIRSVILAQDVKSQPREDLAHILVRWQEAGLAISEADPDMALPPTPLTVDRPSGFKAMWYAALTMAGLRRNSAGGFGSMIPFPPSDSGYGGGSHGFG